MDEYMMLEKTKAKSPNAEVKLKINQGLARDEDLMGHNGATCDERQMQVLTEIKEASAHRLFFFWKVIY